MQALWEHSYLSNSDEYLEQLYEIYLTHPTSLPTEWQAYFRALQKDSVGDEISHEQIRAYFQTLARQTPASAMRVSGDVAHERKQALVKELVYAYRKLGHFQATLDPLGLAPRPSVPELELTQYGLTDADLDQTFLPDHFGDGKPLTLRQLIAALKKVYCQTIGVEYMHIDNETEVRWIQQRFEHPDNRLALSPEQQKRILDALTAAEGLEKYLGTKYVGQKRFSLEGGDSLIPALDALIQRAGSQHIQEIVIGMAHRGRLNVLVNILGKTPTELFNEFEGKAIDDTRSGDVKYHMGFSSDVKTFGGTVHLALAFNPSHLEIVSPVVTGSVNARQQQREANKHQQVLAVQIHGDAAFAGQGVVMETFALSQTRGYGTGGSIHVIVNNQVGFTTDPGDARSTFYCTDVAKMVQAPIFHVNGDDPEAVLLVTQIALDYRMRFRKDVVIDLICYRRHGHNEADEPSATQPIMYQKIKQLPTVRKLYGDFLINTGRLPQATIDAAVDAYRDALDKGTTTFPPLVEDAVNPFTIDWSPYLQQTKDVSTKTAVPLMELTRLANIIHTLPEGMILQPQVAKIIDDQRKMAAGALPLNWGYAETLAYATLLSNGYDVRISGQDVGRGTFAHRHAVLHDYHNGKKYTPLQHVSDKATFTIIDSILSEEAVVAFEYGYATASPKTLVIWEAQFGDFCNGAQVVIDQFISSGEQKWGRLCGLVMLLPHGYEGMGPEHSSARLERFLQLCAEDNMQVCVPSTPAQIFHLLRRQMVRLLRKPLIIMTPKSLLRHKLAVSTLTELAEGEFQSVLPEVDTLAATIQRVIVCAGKVYYDLLEQRRAQKINDIAIVRLEQLYPFPEADMRNILSFYKKTKAIVWCQEEPKNQGAWPILQRWLMDCLNKNQTLRYIGREAAAAPAVGSSKLHAKQQKAIIDQALQGNE